MEERLQKILAEAGFGSRRKCEALIEEGRVYVDGRQAKLGERADLNRQTIEVDGKPIAKQPKVCWMLHKPTSCVTTLADPEGRRTVMEFLPELPVRIYPVGRLDYDTSGLLVLTNDGELANRLMHPKYEIDKVYRATVIGMPDAAALRKLRDGVELEDGRTAPAQVLVLRHHPKESVLELTIHEGRNRQVRRMFDALGFPVKRLKRVQYGPLRLTALGPGKARPLTADEAKALYASVGLEYVGPALEKRMGTAVNERMTANRRNFPRRTKSLRVERG
ncbi:MAG: rRNA pseudouridine synthase [Alicyclobacillus herbarius]|uniref:pseudouridine synthase n=1 Tax=Alicyclobacillus herbarius TaxID=122960 RepID=UPI002352D944|nr:pseudouridine synthase [Alicyclobacillus herbarius]MCL6631271.1 rRNA pseudouridine synthase [Alicyclobacillus herbarius]